MAKYNSEAWLTNAADHIVHDIFEPAGFDTNPATGEPLSERLRARVGYPLAHALRKDIKAIGMCMPSSASAGGFSEIFVSPVLGKGSPMADGDNPRVILATLTHEIGHAVAGYGAGHGPVFQNVMEKIELATKGTDMRFAGSSAADLTPKFCAYADKLIAKLGEYDHYAITTETMPRAATRLLKQVCVNDACPQRAGNRRRSNRITWYWAKQCTELCGACGERMSIYLPRGKGSKGKGAGEKDPNAVPTRIDPDGTYTDTPLSDSNPNTPFHTDPDDEPSDEPGDEPSDEPGDDSDPVEDEPEDDDAEETKSGDSDGKVDHSMSGGAGKAQVRDASGAIVGDHKINMTCTCKTCYDARAAAFK